MSTADGDPVLLAACAGDAAAIDELLSREQGRVYRFALRVCDHPEEARDVAQETLLAAVRGLGDFRVDSSLATWLFTIARRCCSKQRRRRKHAPHHEEPLEGVAPQALVDPGRSPEELVANRQVAAALERAMATLPAASREVLVLRDMEGLTAPEVAAILDIRIGAVKSRLHRARVAMRHALEPLLGPVHRPASCPDVLDLFSRHLEEEIAPATCAKMEQHLSGCPSCRGACDSLRHALAMCRALPPAPVPDDLQEDIRRGLRQLTR